MPPPSGQCDSLGGPHRGLSNASTESWRGLYSQITPVERLVHQAQQCRRKQQATRQRHGLRATPARWSIRYHFSPPDSLRRRSLLVSLHEASRRRTSCGDPPVPLSQYHRQRAGRPYDSAFAARKERTCAYARPAVHARPRVGRVPLHPPRLRLRTRPHLQLTGHTTGRPEARAPRIVLCSCLVGPKAESPARRDWRRRPWRRARTAARSCTRASLPP